MAATLDKTCILGKLSTYVLLYNFFSLTVTSISTRKNILLLYFCLIENVVFTLEYIFRSTEHNAKVELRGELTRGIILVVLLLLCFGGQYQILKDFCPCFSMIIFENNFVEISANVYDIA